MNKEEIMERPKIEYSLNGMSLKEVHLEYQKSPLFRHIQSLDRYIDWQEERNDWNLVSEKQPPIGEELLVQSPFGINHLASWRPAYNIFTCQNKSDSTLDWKWKKI